MEKNKKETLRSDRYRKYFCLPYLMGPNSVRLLDEMLDMCPLNFTTDNCVLDLGCGSGLTSLYLAMETGAKIYAADLWISEEDNRKRIEEWGVRDKIIPVHSGADDLPFDAGFFDAVVSMDAYHYFGGKENYFTEKILPFIKHGGTALICVPGIKAKYEGRREAYLGPWLGEETGLFKSTDEWKKLIGVHREIAEVKTWELFGFYTPWQEWFDTLHEYALRDKQFFDTVIRPFTCFVGIIVRKR
ncbi:MAG: methyltransferase domain-containing protein [Ruminiclostridium sp.]|nr:methyltransferase domain-containing protein [Ruminiclostridium sp.]